MKTKFQPGDRISFGKYEWVIVKPYEDAKGAYWVESDGINNRHSMGYRNAYYSDNFELVVPAGPDRIAEMFS